MFEDLTLFLPPGYCHSCRGCCVFREADGVWGPHLLKDEADDLLRCGRGEGLSADRRHILTEPAGAGHRCTFLSGKDHLCRIYAHRPLECRLYPFVISHEQGRLRLYVHLACPFVQEHFHSQKGAAYQTYLQEYFARPDIRELLYASLESFPDYSSVLEQLEPCFDIAPYDLMERKKEVTEWISCRKVLLSTVSFSGLFSWQAFFRFHFENIDGNMCIFAGQPAGTFLYWPPLGERIGPGAIEEVFLRMRRINRGGGLSRIENVSRDELGFFDPRRYVSRLQGYDYLYYRRDIVGMRGHDYKSRRHDVHLLRRRRDVQYRPFSVADISGCEELFDRWLDKRRRQHDDDIYRHMLQENCSVHRRLIRHAGELGLLGRVVMVEGRLAGYTFGHPLSEHVFCDLLEVTDPDVAGLPAFLFQSLCADEALCAYTFVNVMDDFGMPFVARSKMSYRPVLWEPRYSVSEREYVQDP